MLQKCVRKLFEVRCVINVAGQKPKMQKHAILILCHDARKAANETAQYFSVWWPTPGDTLAEISEVIALAPEIDYEVVSE